MKIGDKVKLNENIKRFKYGKGGVGYDEMGTIIKIDCHKDITVKFPTLSSWNGVEEELVLVNEGKFFKKLPNNFTGTLEVKNGYIVEKEILDDVEKEYLNSVIRPFRNKVKCIKKLNNLKEELGYIEIEILNDTSIIFPSFERNTMYEGMKAYKRYTLKELGLDE